MIKSLVVQNMTSSELYINSVGDPESLYNVCLSVRLSVCHTCGHRSKVWAFKKKPRALKQLTPTITRDNAEDTDSSDVEG